MTINQTMEVKSLYSKDNPVDYAPANVQTRAPGNYTSRISMDTVKNQTSILDKLGVAMTADETVSAGSKASIEIVPKPTAERKKALILRGSIQHRLYEIAADKGRPVSVADMCKMIGMDTRKVRFSMNELVDKSILVRGGESQWERDYSINPDVDVEAYDKKRLDRKQEAAPVLVNGSYSCRVYQAMLELSDYASPVELSKLLGLEVRKVSRALYELRDRGIADEVDNTYKLKRMDLKIVSSPLMMMNKNKDKANDAVVAVNTHEIDIGNRDDLTSATNLIAINHESPLYYKADIVADKIMRSLEELKSGIFELAKLAKDGDAAMEKLMAIKSVMEG